MKYGDINSNDQIYKNDVEKQIGFDEDLRRIIKAQLYGGNSAMQAKIILIDEFSHENIFNIKRNFDQFSDSHLHINFNEEFSTAEPPMFKTPRTKKEDQILRKSELDTILEAANWAPTHNKTEPWRYVVFQGPESITSYLDFLDDFYRPIANDL